MQISIHKRPFKDYKASAYSKGWEVIKLTGFGSLHGILTRYPWSPIVWKDGKRSSENFQEAGLLGLDFDDGPTLQNAQNNIFCDLQSFIGITRNHQKEKHGVVADRYRVLVSIDQAVTDKAAYQSWCKAWISRHDADATCSDPARFFWPCKEIVFFNPDGEIEPAPTGTPPRITTTWEAMHRAQNRVKNYGLSEKSWLKKFLARGELPQWTASRNYACYRAAKELFYLGFSPDKVISLLKNAPFPKQGFHDKEYQSTTSSALKKLKEDLNKNG